MAKGSVASSSRVGKYLLFLLLAVLCSLGLEHYFTAAIGHDQVSYLIEARRWMSGDQLYGPFLSETNPPVIIWISAVSVALARWADLSEIACLKGLTLLCIIASVVSCYRIASRTPILSHPLAKMGMGFAVLALEFALTPSDFSQREHLLVILLTPYLLAVATGVADQLSIAENVAIGLMAAVGIWLKPHDVLVPFGLQLFRCARARSFACLVSRSFLSLLASCISLLGCVLVFAPLYFKQTVPILLDTYWGIGSMTALAAATRLSHYAALVLLLFGLLYVLRKYLAAPDTAAGLLLCSVLAFVACALQHTTWPYHRYPHKAFCCLAVAYVILDLARSFLTRARFGEASARALGASAIAGLLAAWILGVWGLQSSRVDPGPQGTSMDSFLAQQQPGTTVYVFSTQVEPMARVYLHGLNWGGRFAHLWMLPAIVKNEQAVPPKDGPFKLLPPATVARLAALQRTDSAEDLDHWQPAVVLIPTCNPANPCFALNQISFAMLPWFLRGSDFAAAWSHYRKRPLRVENYDVYERVL